MSKYKEVEITPSLKKAIIDDISNETPRWRREWMGMYHTKRTGTTEEGRPIFKVTNIERIFSVKHNGKVYRYTWLSHDKKIKKVEEIL